MTIIKKFDTSEKKESGSGRRYIAIAIAVFLILAVLEIWVSNATVSFGQNYQLMAGVKKNLSVENQILENEISRNSSLKWVASNSSALGLSEPLNIQYIP